MKMLGIPLAANWWEYQLLPQYVIDDALIYESVIADIKRRQMARNS